MDFLKTLGCYPPEYNKAVHGPYYPFRYYGPRDVAFKDVKLNELFSWFKRRNKNPRAIVQGLTRSYELWTHNWVRPYRATAAPIYQFAAIVFLFGYLATYKIQPHHRHRKYHW